LLYEFLTSNSGTIHAEKSLKRGMRIMDRSDRKPVTLLHIFIFIVLVLNYTAFSDIITTYEGNRITGIVTEQSDSTVTIDVGLGSITLNSSQIEDIHLFENGQNDSLRNHWMHEFFAMDPYVPSGFEALARSFRGLEAQRSNVVASKQRIETLSEKRRDLERRLREEEEELIEAYRRLRRLSASLIGPEYNRRVVDINRCRSSVALTQAEIAALDFEIDESYHAIAEYIQSLKSMEHTFLDTVRAYRSKEVSDGTRLFLDTFKERLAHMSAEFQQMSIPYEGLSDGRIVVTAIVNNERSGKFIVDTGASAVALSKQFYESLTDTMENPRSVVIALADGTEMNARQIMLQSIQVGNAHLEGVSAIVLDQGPSKGNDGVLGMSFLGNYGITIDGVRGKLILEEYIPMDTGSDESDSLRMSIQPIFD